jgi:hypothetical protein
MAPEPTGTGGFHATGDDGAGLVAKHSRDSCRKRLEQGEKPVPGATVTIHPSRSADQNPPRATTDQNGSFAFTASVRTDLGDLPAVPVNVNRSGYEPTEQWIIPYVDVTVLIYRL